VSAEPAAGQLAHFNPEEKYHTCLYPTEEMIATAYDLSFLSSKPFTEEIARGCPQLEPRFFEIGVLDRYRLDPRYSFHFYDYAGRLSISSESDKSGPIPERDQISIQTFGLGLDEADNPRVCVFLRYLSQLSPEHQKYWETYLSHLPAKMHMNYYKTSYLGEVYENNSGIAAIRFAEKSLNEICERITGVPLFLNEVSNELHYNLSPFMRSSKLGYLSFVHELDKLVSENINVRFFDGKLDRYALVTHPDGTVERKPKGSLTLLDEWLFSGEIRWPSVDDARREVIAPLRRIRRERQKPAHTAMQNEFDIKYIERRREGLRDTAYALGNILNALTSDPRAPKIRIPKWFEEGRIDAI
jgi:hypothetical protein